MCTEEGIGIKFSGAGIAEPRGKPRHIGMHSAQAHAAAVLARAGHAGHAGQRRT